MACVNEIIQSQREYFKTGETQGYDFRVYELKRLKLAIQKYESRLTKALFADLGKSEYEAYETEIGLLYNEIESTMDSLRSWMRKKRVRTPIYCAPSKSMVYPVPKGVVLIMSPWNYPVLLTLSPLIAAVAAGNCCCVKPSRYSASTSAVIKSMLNEFFKEKYISVFEGGSDMNRELLSIPFEHIFFTGSQRIGKIVMHAAAETLTPVTLELGGKSPCIVDDSANIDLAAKRIIWGKCVNAGQTCIAPDYVLLHSSVKTAFINAAKKYAEQFFGGDATVNPEYPKIINDKHFERLSAMLADENIIYGGKINRDTKKIQPALVLTDETSPLMQEEIFGPILPVITVNALDEAYEIIEKHPHPLALYLFTSRKNTENHVINSIQFGGGCINDAVMHLANPRLPFGGVRESGMGSYHGKAGFDTFTHYKTIMRASVRSDIKLRYAPYEGKLTAIKKFMK